MQAVTRDSHIPCGSKPGKCDGYEAQGESSGKGNGSDADLSQNKHRSFNSEGPVGRR